MESLKLEVFNIFEPASAGSKYSVVSINTPIFKMISGTDERLTLPMVSKGHDKAGNITRAFNIDGTNVWVRYNGKDAQYPNSVIMLTTDAEKLKANASNVYEF